jgi:hypothetical protein
MKELTLKNKGQALFFKNPKRNSNIRLASGETMCKSRRLITLFIFCLLMGSISSCALPSPVAQLFYTKTPSRSPTPTTTATPTATDPPSATPLPPLTLEPCPYTDMCPDAISDYSLVPGDIQLGVVYSVDVPYNQQVSFYTAWIAKDYAILAQNVEHIQFFISIDGQKYWDDSYMAEPEPYVFSDEPGTEYAAQWVGVVLSDWKVGQPHQIRIGFTITEEISDGWDTYASGSVIEHVYTVNPILPSLKTSTVTQTPAMSTPTATLTQELSGNFSSVKIVSHESIPPAGLELWLEFQMTPGDILAGSQIETALNNGLIELVMPDGETKTIDQVPHSPLESELSSDIWLPEGIGIQMSPAPAGMLPLNGMSFENYNDLPNGPQIRIHLEALTGLSVAGQYQISWKSGDLISNVLVFNWDGVKITIVE